MKRRTVFKHLAATTAAAWLLPACVADPKKVSIVLNRLKVTSDEEALLANIAEVMIPQTDTPGAVAVKAHLFALVMVDDCLGKDEQEKYLKGMRGFEDALKSLTGQNFASASPEDRLEMLTDFEEQLGQSGATNEEIAYFYKRTRAYIIQGYTSSQYYLTEVKPYELVPGPNYNGCAPVSADAKTLS